MEKKITASRKKAKILNVNSKSHYPTKTLLVRSVIGPENVRHLLHKSDHRKEKKKKKPTATPWSLAVMSRL